MKERQPRKFVFGSKIDVSKTNMAASSVAGGSGTFIGFDFSTQQIKAVVIDDRLNVVQEAHVQLDSDLPEYRTHGGVYIHEDRKTVTSPTIMWVKGLDMLMDRLRVKGVDISAIKGLSGTAQQHGTVYWKKGARDLLKSLDPDRYLHEQLFDAFAIRESPIWMDSSTTAFCKEFEEKLGSPQRVADITGARAFERASGMQIGKIYHTMPDAYMATERISLVSSFACSLFLGDYAPIDTGDGSGMNLLDIHQKDWSAECLDAVAPDLREKLGEVEYASKCLGHIAPYFVERYSFDPQ
ncbi:unnamed protein product [Darwinula stevensoni]|uniref:Carbohydrate kinase FGGY N-terminal domain-containing protein n=1 Tax=Darwinula stevensoni TaxID=69355 RepID=A0A7R8X7A3_9CRUS|nr:unnamed protein product [Darwinula stevensoni]CAG0882342.1 unnamed protein product [Darwinula stevensoni]